MGHEPEAGVLAKTDSDVHKEKAKVEKAKSKGRFQIVENEEKARAPKAQVCTQFTQTIELPLDPNCLSSMSD